MCFDNLVQELEPQRLREEGVDIFIDLGATQEDHEEVHSTSLPYYYILNASLDQTGNIRDVTMQPGKQRAVLPLIRKFNEHSGRLLQSSL